ncbi:hypothetical protein D3C87_404460 [compost metagenome]|uniref:anti-sigma factor family protein n=1 Tax=Achromobacter sp. Root83 TaxID=1736602 RepID=UPI000708C7A5|nr:hypothetical protein [Achromobacter sp. Root83]KRC73267.1 hypothetical protein ASE30_10700 [Achromobacter sp. Root83]
MPEDKVLSYLSGELDPAARRAFEAELARDPALRAEVDDWRWLAQARQLAHNEIGQADRDSAFLRALAASAPATSAPRSAGRRLWQWIWPTPSGLLMPLGWALAIMLSVVVVLQAPREDVFSDGVATRGGGACPRLAVDLPDGVTARQLRNTLSQYAVSIVSGPDEDGRFVLASTRESSLRDAASALGALSATPAPAGACPRP